MMCVVGTYGCHGWLRPAPGPLFRSGPITRKVNPPFVPDHHLVAPTLRSPAKGAVLTGPRPVRIRSVEHSDSEVYRRPHQPNVIAYSRAGRHRCRG